MFVGIETVPTKRIRLFCSSAISTSPAAVSADGLRDAQLRGTCGTAVSRIPAHAIADQRRDHTDRRLPGARADYPRRR